MQIARVFAGFSMAKADDVRKIMSKKDTQKLAKLKPEWIEGAASRGYSMSLRKNSLISWSHFQNTLSTNPRHSLCNHLAYQIAYLKTHFRLEFMTSLMNMNLSTSENIRVYIQESVSNGIHVPNPDINQSEWNFADSYKQGIREK